MALPKISLSLAPGIWGSLSCPLWGCVASWILSVKVGRQLCSLHLQSVVVGRRGEGYENIPWCTMHPLASSRLEPQAEVIHRLLTPHFFEFPGVADHSLNTQDSFLLAETEVTSVQVHVVPAEIEGIRTCWPVTALPTSCWLCWCMLGGKLHSRPFTWQPRHGHFEGIYKYSLKWAF